MRTVLGVAVGASITAELLARLDTMLLSILLVPPFVIVICLVGYRYFRRICGYDRATAFYSAMPGGLSDMLLFGASAGGNLRSMSLIQVTRVLVVVATLPFILNHSFGMDLSQLSTATHEIVPLSQLALMLFCAACGWRRRGPCGCPPFDPHPYGHFRCTIILSHFQIENGRKVAFTPVCIFPKHPS